VSPANIIWEVLVPLPFQLQRSTNPEVRSWLFSKQRKPLAILLQSAQLLLYFFTLDGYMWVWIDRKYAFICSGLVGPTGKKRCQAWSSVALAGFVLPKCPGLNSRVYLVLEGLAAVVHRGLVPPPSRVRPSMCTPVTLAVPYLLLSLQDV